MQSCGWEGDALAGPHFPALLACRWGHMTSSYQGTGTSEVSLPVQGD